MKKKSNGLSCKRFWEIDVLRGVAIVLMIFYHFLYDLDWLFGYNINFNSVWISLLQKIIAVTFFCLVGISLTLSYNKYNKVGMKRGFGKYLERGVLVFLLGLLITVITFVFLGEGFVVFGVLHFIGISIIISYPLIRYKYINLVLGFLCLIVGNYITSIKVGFSWLLWLGIMPRKFFSVDYYPLLPWLGFIFIGIFLGNLFYRNHKQRFILKDYSKEKIIELLSFFGRNSLVIYLIHQPILIGIFYILQMIVF